MARRKDPRAIDGMWAIRPDHALREAVANDLAILRELKPRATRSDVLRSWAWLRLQKQRRRRGGLA